MARLPALTPAFVAVSLVAVVATPTFRGSEAAWDSDPDLQQQPKTPRRLDDATVTLNQRARKVRKGDQTMEEAFNCVGDWDQSRWRHNDKLHRDEWLCTKKGTNFVWGMDPDGNVLAMDLNGGEIRLLFENNELCADETGGLQADYLMLSEAAAFEVRNVDDILIWRLKPKVQIGPSYGLQGYPTPYLHLRSQTGKQVLNYIGSVGWVAADVKDVYELPESYGRGGTGEQVCVDLDSLETSEPTALLTTLEPTRHPTLVPSGVVSTTEEMTYPTVAATKAPASPESIEVVMTATPTADPMPTAVPNASANTELPTGEFGLDEPETGAMKDTENAATDPQLTAPTATSDVPALPFSVVIPSIFVLLLCDLLPMVWI